jgi:PilZ domain
MARCFKLASLTFGQCLRKSLRCRRIHEFMTNPAPKIGLAAVAQHLARVNASARERRRFRRLPMVVGGRMLDTLGREHDCRTSDISPGDVRIHAPVLPNVGERVVLYLEGFGRLTGNVARRGEQDAAIIFDFSAHKREKLTDQLTLAINKNIAVELYAKAQAPSRRVEVARVETEAGEVYSGEILDFSLTGITIRSPKPAPPLGAWVRAGGAYGRVARMIEGGFAVDFETRGRPAP